MIDGRRAKPCAPVKLPAILADALAGYEWQRDTVGESGSNVHRLHGKPGAPDVYLKHGKGGIADDIRDEAARLRWLAAYLPVPAVAHFIDAPGQAWLVTTALPGKTAWEIMDGSAARQPGVVDALARFLRRLHAIPVSECPFTSDVARRLVHARERIDAGLVDEDDFDDEREGWTAQQVWEALQAMLPLAPDPVVTHGDFSLDNLLIDDGEVVGCIDVGRDGVADRYQDLAIAWNFLGEFGASLQQRLFAKYGIQKPNQDKLTFHLLLDELF